MVNVFVRKAARKLRLLLSRNEIRHEQTSLAPNHTHWEPIWPRIPPLDGFTAVGRAENYFIHDGYRVRLNPEFFDDTPLREQWQKEVYWFGREVADRFAVTRVMDIGCGSGFKLMQYFSDLDTLGLDLEPTVRFLREKYPGRRWEICDFGRPPEFEPELVICADVIEHLVRPEELVRFIRLMRPRLIVISTPERNLLMHGTHNGPPKNPAHVREWSMSEFRAFMESEFELLAHFISNGAQATQCVLARLKDGETNNRVTGAAE